MRVLHAAAEVFPLVKTGGLGDVVGALPAALADWGVEARLVLPGLPAILDGVERQRPIKAIGPAFGDANVSVSLGALPSGLPTYVIDAPYLYRRAGGPYQDPQGLDWNDNHRRFGLLGWAAARLAAGDVDPDWRAQLVHAHDWHAGLAVAHAAADPAQRCESVFTIHNLAFQGLFPAAAYAELGLPPDWFVPAHVEFYGQVSFIKAALVHARRLVAVSPNYADEIRGPEFGCGLDGVIRDRGAALTGILNGVDYAVWNPATDPLIAQRYDAAQLDAKAANKAALQRELGLAVDAGVPLFGVVSRLTGQKGLDLVLGALRTLIGAGAQLAVLGSGEPGLERGFVAAAGTWRGAMAVRIGYDESLAHRMIAGCDSMLVPSRFEPCGLTQMYALRYGTVPLVRRIGGLADTVDDAERAGDDAATGFAFDAATAPALAACVQRALDAWRDPLRWRALMRRGMARDFSWQQAARGYLALYLQLVPDGPLVAAGRAFNRQPSPRQAPRPASPRAA